VEERAYANDAIEVAVLPQAGARLHRLRAFGHDLLRTPDDPAIHLADPFFWGAYVMAPWCNRIEAGPVRFASHRLHITPNFPDGTAIHGQVYLRPWAVENDGGLAVRMGGEGWPWPYEVRQRLVVSGAELRIELALTNLGRDAMPGGLGLHPWFVKPVRVAIHAGGVFPDNTETEASPRDVAGPFDQRALGELAEGMDATWVDLSDPAVELVWPGRVRATMRIHAPQVVVVAASPPDTDAVALEPQTHAPQGIRRLMNGEHAAMELVPPGEALSMTVVLNFEQLKD